MIKFITFMTGAKGDTLRRAGHTSIQRYLHYALLMLIPISLWFAIIWKYSGFWYAGVIAMLVVFFFDRSIIGNGSSRGFNIGRGVIALIMGLFGSMIVDEAIFHDEINSVVESKQNTEQLEDRDVLLIDRQIDQAQEDVAVFTAAYNKEVNDLGGHGKKAENALKAKNEAQARLDALYAEQRVKSEEAEKEYGHLDRAIIMWTEVAPPFSFRFFVAILIFIVTLTFEMMPLLFKWFGGKVYYQELLAIEEDMERVKLHQERVEATLRKVA